MNHTWYTNQAFNLDPATEGVLTHNKVIKKVHTQKERGRKKAHHIAQSLLIPFRRPCTQDVRKAQTLYPLLLSEPLISVME